MMSRGGLMWKRIESVTVRRQLGIFRSRSRFKRRKSSPWFNVDGSGAEPDYANAFARGTVRRLKFADRTFSAKRRERIANRSGGTSDITDAASRVH